MDFVYLLKAFILGIVEGLTEFLPISSTGHLILASNLLGMHGEKVKIFNLVIQTGAMLAIIWEYRVRFWNLAVGVFGSNYARGFVLNLFIGCLPIALLGLLFGDFIKAYLFAPVPVALAFIIGGFIIFWAERSTRLVRIVSADDMRWPDALKVGLVQAFALIPGTSRSGATIIGGMLLGMSRHAATEFSFFLAVPTLMAAGAYDLYQHRALFSWADLPPFAVGLVTSFISAFICVRWLIRYVAHHDFRMFAWYRIIFGAVVLITAYAGWVDWSRT